MAVHCSVTQRDDVDAAVGQVLEQCSAIHGLLNCVGITGATGIPAHEVSLDDFQRVLAVNLTGAFTLSQRVLPVMLAPGTGGSSTLPQ